MNEKDQSYLDMIEAQSEAALIYAAKTIAEQNMQEYLEIEQQSKGYEISPVTHEKLRRMIQAKRERATRQRRSHILKKAIKIGAIVLLVTISVSVLLFNSVDAFRYRFEGFFTRIIPGAYELTPEEHKENAYYYPDYLPDQYTLSRTGQKGEILQMVFENMQGDSFELEQQPANDSKVYLDSDATLSGQVQINEIYVGYWTKNADETVLLWLQDDTIFCLQ